MIFAKKVGLGSALVIVFAGSAVLASAGIVFSALRERAAAKEMVIMRDRALVSESLSVTPWSRDGLALSAGSCRLEFASEVEVVGGDQSLLLVRVLRPGSSTDAGCPQGTLAFVSVDAFYEWRLRHSATFESYQKVTKEKERLGQLVRELLLKEELVRH